jgi:hypothetical protein
MNIQTYLLWVTGTALHRHLAFVACAVWLRLSRPGCFWAEVSVCVVAACALETGAVSLTGAVALACWEEEGASCCEALVGFPH